MSKRFLSNNAMRAMRTMAGSFLALVWFAVLFLAAIVVATVTLSASQLQSRLQTLSRADSPLTVWQIERVREEWSNAQSAIRNQSAAVDRLRSAANAAKAEASQKQLLFNAADSECDKRIDEVRARLVLYVPLDIPDDLSAMDDQAQRGLIARLVDQLATKLEPGNKQKLDLLQASYVDALNAKTDSRTAAQLAETSASNATGDFERELAILTEETKKLDAIINPAGSLTKIQVDQVYDLISEFNFMQEFALGTLYRFSILPNEFLIIVLVIAMGVLGSTLQLTYDYYRAGGIQKTSQFFLRPMLGAITALVVFVLLKAGVLVVTDSAKLGEVAPLNPFFIAFVGIVSGLLSENALEMIRRVGNGWLRGSAIDREARWATSITADLLAAKTLADLAAVTGIAQADLEKWASQEEATPPDMQRVFAAWLGKDRRTLFTDIAPAA